MFPNVAILLNGIANIFVINFITAFNQT